MFKNNKYGDIVYSVKKKIILWSIGTILFGLAICLVIYVCFPNNNTNSNSDIDKEKDNEIISIEPTFKPMLRIEKIKDIQIHNDDEPYTIDIKVTCNEDYTITTSANNDNIVVNYNIVTPIKVGKSVVQIKVKSSSNEVIQNVNIEVLPSEITANFSILKNDTTPTHLFVGEDYILQLDLSKKSIYNFDIFYSENIENFQLIKKENTKIKCKFKIKNNGEIKFDFKYKDYTKSFKNTAFDYVSNINITFSREIKNNIINLFLFNNNYTNLATDNDIFNEIEYTITNQENFVNNYSTSVENSSIAQVLNNKISAQNEGTTNFVIQANDGSNYKQTYQIVVKKIKIQNLGVQDEEIALNIKDAYPIPQITFLPVYAIANIVYYYDNNEYTGNILTFEKAGTHRLKVVDTISNLSATITLIIQEKSESDLSIKVDPNFLHKETAVFDNDILTVTTNEPEIEISFSCVLKDNAGGTEIECTLQSFSNTITITSKQLYNGYVITLTGKGIAHFTLTLKKDPSITYSFDVVIN